ncbi:MAG: hypothetical protein Q9184_005743, partial [Pyrenodesmia sp. 2 TL-2023]
MDALKNAVGMGGGENKAEGQTGQAGEQTQQSSGGGGFMDKINSMAGGGKESEAKEDYLDKGIDMVQEKFMGAGPQDNESAIEQAKDEQMSDFIRGKILPQQTSAINDLTSAPQQLLYDMTTAMSKRTQVRNEKALQDLIKTVPGNDRCADCAARNPGWASWSLGIFLCMRCASLHRKLGTHISKVKSLSMDSWTNDQVESMRRNGNVASNQLYNPRNSKPAIPLDVDEVDAALERFIRQKYDQQTFSGGGAVRPTARQDTGTSSSTRSSDDHPPPLPPKPGKRFGFGLRSVSSALPMTKHSHISPPTSPDTANGYPPLPPIRVNKQSRVFGASVGGGGEHVETKLATLRDMGFWDEKRNTTILKGLDGNLERTIETLVRLGDGNTPASRPRSPVKPRQIAVSQPFSSVGVEPPHEGSGITVHPSRSVEPLSAAAPLPPVPPTNPGNRPSAAEVRSYNPFEVSSVRTDTWPLENGLENLQISPKQPLFPNATGGYPIQPEHIQAVRFQQSMTPPVPQLHHHIHSNPYAQQMPNANGNFNPFFQASQQATLIPSNPYSPHSQYQPNGNAYDPFMAMQPPSQSCANGIIQQSAQSFVPQHSSGQQPFRMADQGQPVSMRDHSQLYKPNQYPPQQLSHVQPPSQFQRIAPLNPHQPGQLQAQPTGRFDKSSILALYNYPQLAPPPLLNANDSGEIQVPSAEAAAPASASPMPRAPGQRSVTMPAPVVAGSRNPFLTSQQNNAAVSSNAVPAIPSGLSRHVSQESVDVGNFQRVLRSVPEQVRHSICFELVYLFDLFERVIGIVTRPVSTIKARIRSSLERLREHAAKDFEISGNLTSKLATSEGKAQHTLSTPSRQKAFPGADLVKALRTALSPPPLLPSIPFLDTLRAYHPDAYIARVRSSIGLLEYAVAGHASYKVDNSFPWYGSLTPRKEEGRKTGTALNIRPELIRYNYTWRGNGWLVYAFQYYEAGHQVHDHYIVVDLPSKEQDSSQAQKDVAEGKAKKAVEKLILAASNHGTDSSEDEIWVYESGYWRKSKRLWTSVQTSSWDDVVLNEDLKKRIREDLEGFFRRKSDYKAFGVPWKRGIIVHGLPGNGKTLSIKASMQSLSTMDPPIPSLYVKSLGKKADSDDIQEVFEKARTSAPCLLIFEDLDSLVGDNVRSLFLNEVDGLEGNDGIMMIGSTNYLDKLDPGISKRPSRFDRKYHFALPKREERKRY